VKAAVLRAVDAKRVPMPGQEPGIADLLDYLRERPALYEQLVQAAQVASAWAPTTETAPEGWTHRLDARTGRELAVVVLSDGLWVADLLDRQLPGTWLSPREAQGAVDAELRKLGWTLIDAVRS
jgi:hypothetical protein